jgi:hypothetical protein
MKILHRILYRSVTEPFYQQHAGLFLFAFFILFGIQPSAYHILQFHYSIILSILDSPLFFGVAFMIWATYTLKVVLFIRSCFKKEAYDFLYQLLAIPKLNCQMYLARMLLVMLAPLLVYALVIIAIAVREGYFLSGSLVIVAVTFLFLAAVFSSWQLLKKAKDNQRIQKNIKLPLRAGLFSLLLQFVFRKQFITLLILKTVSFAVLYFFAKTDSQVFEGRMLWLLYITALAGHGVIIFRNFHFMENELSFYRNLPVSYGYTFLSLAALYTVLLIPEIWALKGILLIQHNGMEYCWLILTGPSLLLLIHSMLYAEDLKMQDFLGLLFGIWVVFIFFSLSSMHWLMSVIGFVFGFILFRMSYYKYERKLGAEEQTKKVRDGKRPTV